MKKTHAIPALSLALLALLLSGIQLYSQIIESPDLNGVRAEEEFRGGIEAYKRFAYNDAIRAFETALSYRPGEALLLDWLGRAYFKSGLEEEALRQWEYAAEVYGEGSDAGALALARAETVRARQSQIVSMAENSRFVNGGAVAGLQDGARVFLQPASILPAGGGASWVAAYTSNEIVLVDPNGVVKQRARGPLGGFDRPYGIARGLDGRLYVSEFRGGRLSVLSADGVWQSHIGGKGRGAGQLSGPSSMTVDDEGYVYVIEYGNRRISKFSPDGDFIYNFGQKDGIFPGFLSPTGIVYINGRIFAADNLKKTLYTFDTDGMYLDIFLDEGLEAPEGLKKWDENTLLVADSRRLLFIDVNSAIIREAGFAGNRTSRVIDAGIDQNGAILTANFDKNEVGVLFNVDSLAGGLFVQIDRIVTDQFPIVTLDVSVTDRGGRPIVGLSDRNFLLSEGQQSESQPLVQAANQELLGGLDAAPGADIIIVVERSAETLALRDELAAALRDIYNAARVHGINIAGIISAGENPERERYNLDLPSSITTAGRGRQEAFSPRWRFDSAVRLAGDALLPLSKKRAIFFVTSGALGENAFNQYNLSQLAAYLKNSNIGFYAVVAGENAADGALLYLADAAGGEASNLYAPAGIGGLVAAAAERAAGSYLLRYRSSLPTDFGRAFLPIEAEVYLWERSGRDRSGYFAPLS